MALYPILVGEIAKRNIKRKSVAQALGITEKALYNKIIGKSPFTWPEVRTIRKCFFPDIPSDVLFEESPIDRR